jgi:enoyl-CoA hydratase/carnithine racemase
MRYRGAMIETVAEHLVLERSDRVAVVTVDRPDARNAMTFAMYDALHGLCERLDADASVRVMILTGAGDQAFVSGTDIRQFQTFTTREDALGYEARISRVLDRIAGMSKPTMAVIQGDAVGGGLFMALACDLRLAAEHARFGVPIARTVGNFAAPTSLALMVATVGPVRAREMVITARLLGAAEAKTIGLVDEVHPGTTLASRARELAARVAEHAPLTLAGVKEAIRRYIAAVTPRDLEDLILSCYLSEDFQEGVRAFLEKRPADWKGR